MMTIYPMETGRLKVMEDLKTIRQDGLSAEQRNLAYNRNRGIDEPTRVLVVDGCRAPQQLADTMNLAQAPFSVP